MEKRRSTRQQHDEIEEVFHLKRTMQELGWRCVRHTGTGKPNRFAKTVQGSHTFYVTSAPGGLWRLERDTGRTFRSGPFVIRQMQRIHTHRFETCTAMALWFDYCGTALLRIQQNGF